MKWHMFQTNFWDSKTAVLLEAKCGAKGVLIYLKIIGRIASDISSAADIEYAIEHGWRKNLMDWCRIAKVSNAKLQLFVQNANELGLFESQIEIDSKVKSVLWLTIKIRNLYEFLPVDALSSTQRKAARIQLGGQMAANERPVGPLYNIIRYKKEELAAKASNSSAFEFEKFQNIWNEHHPTNKANGLFPKRLELVIAAWNEKPDWSYWVDIISKAASSDFLVNKKVPKVNLDWVIENHIKIGEGRYENRNEGTSDNRINRLME